MIKAEIRITLKEGVLDPQGVTLKRSLDTLGYRSVQEVRFGKLVQLRFEGTDTESVRPQVEEICRRVLANPVIETFSYHLESEAQG